MNRQPLTSRRALALILALCAVTRLAVLLAFPQVFAFDQTGTIHGSEAYDTYARNLLTTGVFGRQPGIPDAALPPLYSHVLAALYTVLGRSSLQVGVCHILLDMLSIALLYAIARRLFPRGDLVGLVGGLCYALYPYLIFQNLTLIDTPLFMTLLHAFLLTAVLLREYKLSSPSPSGRREKVPLPEGKGFRVRAIGRELIRALLLATLCGFILGLATLVRPVMIPLAGLVVVWFLFRLSLRQTVIRLLPVALAAALTLVPWTLRNAALYGAFIPIALTGGGNFFQGNNADVIPYLRAGYDVQWIGLKDAQAEPNTLAAERELMDAALTYLRTHPAQIPELLWVKFLAHWSIDIFPRRNPVEGVVPPLDYHGSIVEEANAEGGVELGGLPQGDPVAAYAEPLFDRIGRTVHKVYFGGLLLLALVGVVLTRRQWRDISLLWFVQISMTLMYVVFHPSTRYRVPTDPLLFLFSAAALVAVFLKFWRRES